VGGRQKAVVSSQQSAVSNQQAGGQLDQKKHGSRESGGDKAFPSLILRRLRMTTNI
jgi:hypothetical protein